MKRKMIIGFCLILAAFVFFSGASAESKVKKEVLAQSKGLTIGELDNSGYRYFDGAGHPQIWKPKRGKYGGSGYFYMLPNQGDGAYMNLDGRVVTVIKIKTNRSSRIRKGTKFYELYKGAGYSVRVNYTVTRTIASEHGGVEKYSVTITVQKGNLSKTVSGLGEAGD